MSEKKETIKKILKDSFDLGHLNAAASFSKMINDTCVYNPSYEGFQQISTGLLSAINTESLNRSDVLITTELLGDVPGKSYLILSIPEIDELTKGFHLDFKVEFLKELDNILSASVITLLANKLNLKIYGGVPILITPISNDLSTMIYEDFNKDKSQEVYIYSIYFSLTNFPNVNPHFIWVMDKEIIPILEATFKY